MANYKQMAATEVERLAKQGDKDALYEMAFRPELMPSGRGDSVEECAWQDYWFERAADAKSSDARLQYGRSLYEGPMDAERRKKAYRYFDSLAGDILAGRFSSEYEQQNGMLGKFWLGIMLCEGYHTPRNPKTGVKHIEEARVFFNDFQGFGFALMLPLGTMYANGLAQLGEEPSIEDLEKAIKYLGVAINTFDPARNNPRLLDVAKKLLEAQEKRLEAKRGIGEFLTGMGAASDENTINEDAYERRKEILERPLSDAVRQRLDAEKAAIARLRQRFGQ